MQDSENSLFAGEQFEDDLDAMTDCDRCGAPKPMHGYCKPCFRRWRYKDQLTKVIEDIGKTSLEGLWEAEPGFLFRKQAD